MHKIYNVEEKYNKLRLDKVISSHFNISRTRAENLIESNKVMINKVIINKKKTIVNTDDIIEIELLIKELMVKKEDIDINIIYEDKDLLIVNKEKNMVVHPSAGHESGTLVNALLNKVSDLSGINGIIRPGIVHRIDKNTTGLLVVAKNDNAHNFLSEQFKEHSITREYHAIVYGNFQERKGKIDFPIGKDKNIRTKQAIDFQRGKRAVTNFEVIEDLDNASYLKINLETGRTHQIRVHFNYINHSVIGDDVYYKPHNIINTNGQALHAKKLGFIHPVTKKYMEFDSKLPDYFYELIDYYKKGL